MALAIGPTTETRNSAPGVFGDVSMRVTPPSGVRPIERTTMPSSRATRAWPASWASTEISRRTAPQNPAAQ